MTRTRFNDLKDEIHELHMLGISPLEISKRCGISVNTARAYIYKIFPTRELLAQEEQTIKDMILAGIDTTYISDLFSVPQRIISQIRKTVKDERKQHHLERRFYVYVHKDENDIVVYIGSGSGVRYKNKTGRGRKHLSVFNDLKKEIVAYGLTKQEAMVIEDQLITNSNTLLLNCKQVSSPHKIASNTLHTHFYYDESSPSCIKWKVGTTSLRKSRVKYGEDAGCINKSKGYYVIGLAGKNYFAHRVVYALHNGDFDEHLVIDHIDGNKLNNKIENLRAVTSSINSKNRQVSKNNSTGVTGVSWIGSTKTWSVSWVENGKLKSFVINPKTNFPFEDEEMSTKSSFELAVFTRKLVEYMFYDKEFEWPIQ